MAREKGSEIFFEALREYVERFAYEQADAAGFLQILREKSAKNLDDVFERYLSSPEG